MNSTEDKLCVNNLWENKNNIPSINVHRRDTRTRVAHEVGRGPVPLTLPLDTVQLTNPKNIYHGRKSFYIIKYKNQRI